MKLHRLLQGALPYANRASPIQPLRRSAGSLPSATRSTHNRPKSPRRTASAARYKSSMWLLNRKQFAEKHRHQPLPQRVPSPASRTQVLQRCRQQMATTLDVQTRPATWLLLHVPVENLRDLFQITMRLIRYPPRQRRAHQQAVQWWETVDWPQEAIHTVNRPLRPSPTKTRKAGFRSHPASNIPYLDLWHRPIAVWASQVSVSPAHSGCSRSKQSPKGTSARIRLVKPSEG